MKKLIILLMLTGFSLPAHAGMLANLPSLVLAPFGDPCPDCKMSVISELYTQNDETSLVQTVSFKSVIEQISQGNLSALLNQLKQSIQHHLAGTVSLNGEVQAMAALSDAQRVLTDQQKNTIRNIR